MMSSRILVAATSVILSTVAIDAGAHGSRLVPIEDAPIPAASAKPKPLAVTKPYVHDWAGFYLGAHVAYDVGGSASELRSVFGGVQLGYDLRLPARWVVGVEGDISFPYFAEDGAVASQVTPRGTVGDKLDFLSTVRGRVGRTLGPWLIYLAGGVAWSQARFTETPGVANANDTILRWPIGWTAGAGAELALSPVWTLKLEYLFTHLGDTTVAFPSGTSYQAAALDVHGVRLGLNWHFGRAGEQSANSHAWPEPEDWNAHGQFTFIEQGYFSFHSPYESTNSLSGDTQFRNTMSATAFLGMRLWRGAELYFNPELDQGFGLSGTVGVAGFPNGEAQKASYPVPRLNVDRLMVRQTFGLGGDHAKVEDGPNQLPGQRDVSRITVTIGRFSVGDAFGLNTYAADPRTQFFNWNIYGSGSYDWTMDKPGFTWGALVELNQKRWAVRAGYFLEPTESNGNSFDTHIPDRGQYLIEPELRYSIFSQPGRLRLLGWITNANMGSYSEAVGMPITTPNYPDITQTRRVRINYGVVANLEQAITRDLGVFSRASYSPGQVEVMGWTDCDASLSAGLLLTGTVWRRPNDKLGFAGVIEGLSPEARAYFAAGGMGIVIGDGRLSYGTERILETYYSLGLTKWASLTLDYQAVVNPGYNADRGPVSIYAARLHLEL